MKKMCAVLLIFLLLFQSACYAEENQYRASSYDDQDLLNAYEALGIMDGATIDALKSGLSIRIEEEMKGVTLKDNVLYILSGSGVYKISTNGNYVFFPIDKKTLNNKINPRKIFSYNEEVWALAYDFQAAYDCYSNGIPVEDLGHVYGKLNFMPDGVAFEPVTELDTGLYSNKELFGLLSGIQSSPFVQGEHVYSIDNIGSKRDNSQYSVLSMISYDLTTGKGKEICLFPAAYNLTAYTEDMILSFHTDGWRYLGGYRNQAPFDMDQVLLVKTDLTTGEQEVVDLFEPGNRDVYYNTCGAPSGLAYDQDDDLLYYTWNGKLHRRQGLDPETDEVIADAPSSWLKMRYYVDCGYLTDDGYYISVAPDYGIDIIDIKIDGQ